MGTLLPYAESKATFCPAAASGAATLKPWFATCPFTICRTSPFRSSWFQPGTTAPRLVYTVLPGAGAVAHVTVASSHAAVLRTTRIGIPFVPEPACRCRYAVVTVLSRGSASSSGDRSRPSRLSPSGRPPTSSTGLVAAFRVGLPSWMGALCAEAPAGW